VVSRYWLAVVHRFVLTRLRRLWLVFSVVGRFVLPALLFVHRVRALLGRVLAPLGRLLPEGPLSRLAVALLVVIGVFAAGCLALATRTAVALSRFEKAEARRTTYVYAAGPALAPGVNVRAVDLPGTLGRLKYSEVRAMPAVPGQFRRTAAAWELLRREAAPELVRLELRGDRIAKITVGGEPVEAVELEGEVLTSAGDRAGEDYRPVRLAEVPPVVLRAVLAAEDHRYFDHRGLDLRGLARAAWTNVRAGRVQQGGSTITQQLVKNRLLSPRRTYMRKLDEAWLATMVEWRYPKERILEAYLNEIYLGQRGALAVRGVGAAARAYFGKEVHQLTLGESALLAGMVRAPNTYSPAANPTRARERRDVVLARLRELGWISDTDLEAARAEKAGARGGPGLGQPAPYFTDFVRQELEQVFGDDALARARGAHLRTSVDLALQRFAEAAVSRGLDRLETRHRALRRAEVTARLQAAMVVLDPATGR
jgi:penicillin-binding protein 1B